MEKKNGKTVRARGGGGWGEKRRQRGVGTLDITRYGLALSTATTGDPGHVTGLLTFFPVPGKPVPGTRQSNRTDDGIDCGDIHDIAHAASA